MPRAALRQPLLLAVLAAAALGVWPPARGLADPPAAAPRVTDLGYLEGAWSATHDGSTWEACYTSAAGGEVVSATKEIKAGKVVTFDFERFFEKDGKVIFQPFPGGRKALEFPLTRLDVAARKAVFENPANDFPMRFTYHRTGDTTLRVTLEGDPARSAMTMVLEFRRTERR